MGRGMKEGDVNPVKPTKDAITGRRSRDTATERERLLKWLDKTRLLLARPLRALLVANRRTDQK